MSQARIPGLFWVVFVAASAVTVGSARYTLAHPEEDDFASFHRSGRALMDGNLAGLYHRELDAPGDEPFVRPPAYALLFLPLSRLSLPSAFWGWISFQLLILGCCLFWAQHWIGWQAAALSWFFAPMLLGITHGQDCALILGALVAAYVLHEQDRPILAGIALAAGFVKFHLFLLWPAALIVQRRWRMLAGLAVAGAAGAAASIALVGVQGMEDYGKLLVSGRLSAATPDLRQQYGVAGLWANLHWAPGASLYALIAGIAGLSLYAIGRGGLRALFVVAPISSLAIAPHALYYDPAILLLSLWLALPQPSRSRYLLLGSALIVTLVLSAEAMPPPFPSFGSAGLLVFTVLAGFGALRGHFPDLSKASGV